MSFSRLLLFPIAITLSGTACAANSPVVRYTCPASTTANDAPRAITRVEVFDTAPGNGGTLMPEETPTGNVWRDLKGRDVYFVCSYGGTAQTVTVHAPRVSACTGTSAPFGFHCE